MNRFAIKSNKIVTPSAIQQGFLLINNGKIEAIVHDANHIGECTVIDASDNVVMPGVIDPHVHINEPGRTEWEGFETATKAALFGGVTMLVDMPLNSSPVTTTVAAFEEKLAAATSTINTHVGFWGGVVPGNENEITGLIQNGVLGFKAFLTHSGIDDFPNVTADDLHKAMPTIAKYDLPLLVHCELSDAGIYDTELNSNPTSYSAYLNSRPRKWENDAIALMIKLCEAYNCRVHIVHLSSSDAIKIVEEAKQKGLPVTAETAQHYLYFNAEEIPDGNTSYKCAPPIREKSNNELLWKALQSGIIDFVATDHSPAPPYMKCMDTGDFSKAWGGIASIQFALPVLWTAAKERGFTMIDIVKWLCENPAKLAGQMNKGKLQPGYDADLCIFNEAESFIVEENMIQHRHKITPYLNKQLTGVVKQTYLKGKLVFDNKVAQLHKGDIVVSNV